MAPLKTFVCICFLSLFLYGINAVKVTHDGRAIKIDGKRRVLISGSIHYPRSTPGMWPDLIKKAKEGGLDAIETYVFWNAHEPVRCQYDFTGNNDLIRFLKTIQDEGLFAVLRIGPYVCAEWDYGGIPVWVHNLPGVEIRTANKVYMNEMQNFTTLIVDMVRKEKLFASQGGPIILSQIENEYGNVMSTYGDAGKAYIDWCANMAESFNIGVPWIMCQQSNAPQPMINTCNGWYCHDFKPNNANSPKMWTENWVGWFKNWGSRDPHRTAEDVAYAVARFYQTGGTFQNYYMYHGGTNFGRTAGGPYITTTYDYDAPLDEYGNIAQPKWGHLKELHLVLKSMENSLTNGNVSETDLGNSVKATIYATKDSSSCFLTNTNTTSDATVTFRGNKYNVPAWSVSLLPDCRTEEYNTAKVNVQTSLMVKGKTKAEDEPTALKWVWRAENIDDALLGKGNFSANILIDQKRAAADDSDYLWYMTRLDLNQSDPIWSDDISLRISGTGHAIYAFINGEHIGSHWATYGIRHDKFETKIKLKPGKNIISLLSVTVGLQNYGENYDKWQAGLVGPIEVIGRKGDETIVKDLSKYKWTYKVGLHGWDNKFFSEDSPYASASKWESDLPINRKFTWYKTTFKAPLGSDPVVVDLQGMGKGYAWVNGQNLGRMWPSYNAMEEGCSDEPCDYRGEYSDKKCVSNCGKPTQRWYHVPRSFIKDGVNTLVLFEEIGGNPSLVNFQTIFVGTACGNTRENKTLELSCHGRPISDIKFASFGNPQGECGAFTKGSCESKSEALSIVQKACVGKESCSIEVSEKSFGKTSCGDVVKRLAVEAVC
ncbi:beta-galactosidase 15 [Cajanus cajan]|uniref:Beta-galactosidase n=1 Tax=Cajanus cajan TaxID=3821 RepID=A0A151RAD1_CAJCA|nr:beta-galactosidase 15 [Cajanus cajan]KYP39466.1 Beta-galactosidase 15 [Cajanus cajan]